MTSVYTMRSSDGTVLYVGLTGNPLARMAYHLDKQPWATDISRIDLLNGFSEKEAAAKEAQLILELAPLHNRALAVSEKDTALRRQRRKRSYTQKQLASKSGVSQGTISLLEAGRTAPGLTTTLKLAEALDVSIEDLLD